MFLLKQYFSHTYLNFVKTILYICFMQWLTCPICGQKGLIKTLNSFPPKRVVCENEFFVHYRIGMVDMLAHTELSEKEEVRQPQTEPVLMLALR